MLSTIETKVMKFCVFSASVALFLVNILHYEKEKILTALNPCAALDVIQVTAITLQLQCGWEVNRRLIIAIGFVILKQR